MPSDARRNGGVRPVRLIMTILDECSSEEIRAAGTLVSDPDIAQALKSLLNFTLKVADEQIFTVEPRAQTNAQRGSFHVSDLLSGVIRAVSGLGLPAPVLRVALAQINYEFQGEQVDWGDFAAHVLSAPSRRVSVDMAISFLRWVGELTDGVPGVQEKLKGAVAGMARSSLDRNHISFPTPHSLLRLARTVPGVGDVRLLAGEGRILRGNSSSPKSHSTIQLPSERSALGHSECALCGGGRV